MVLGNRIPVVLWDVDEKVLVVLWDVEDKVLEVLWIDEKVLEVLKVRSEEGAGSAVVLILLCYPRVSTHTLSSDPGRRVIR